MTKYTDVCALIEDMRDRFNKKFRETEPSKDFAAGFMMAVRLIEDAPAADVVEVRHGRWIEIKSTEESSLCECTYCKRRAAFSKFCFPPDYCPSCGAKMDMDEEEECDPD